MPSPSCRLAWCRLAVATLARSAVALVLAAAFWAVAPTLIGSEPTTVMSASMAPRIHPGDVVVSRPVAASALRPGQVLLVDDPDRPGALRLHRFLARDDSGTIITKGDANRIADPARVPAGSVRGVALVRIPLIGYPVLWARTGETARLVLVALGTIAALALTGLDAPLRREPVTPPDGQDGPGAPPTRRVMRRRRASAGAGADACPDGGTRATRRRRRTAGSRDGDERRPRSW